MATSHVRRAACRASGEPEENTVRGALQLIAKGITALQGALTREDERAEQKIRDALALQEERAERRMQEALRAHQETNRAAQEALRLRAERAEEAERNLREKVEAQETRLQQLEASLQRTLSVFFPRVEALVAQMEGRPPAAPSDADGASAASPSTPPPVLPPPQASSSMASATEAPSQPMSPECRFALGRYICQAALEGRLEDVRRLVDAGADIEALDIWGRAPLHCAASRADAAIVQLLLERGANVNARDRYEWSPLHYAACDDSGSRCAALLLDAGADVESKNVFGETPLHWAAREDNEAAVRALLARGASKTATDRFGRWPYDVADADAVRRLL